MFTNHNIDTREKALLGLLECGHNRYFTVYIPMGDTVSFSYSWCTYYNVALIVLQCVVMELQLGIQGCHLVWIVHLLLTV